MKTSQQQQKHKQKKTLTTHNQVAYLAGNCLSVWSVLVSLDCLHQKCVTCKTSKGKRKERERKKKKSPSPPPKQWHKTKTKMRRAIHESKARARNTDWMLCHLSLHIHWTEQGQYVSSGSPTVKRVCTHVGVRVGWEALLGNWLAMENSHTPLRILYGCRASGPTLS